MTDKRTGVDRRNFVKTAALGTGAVLAGARALPADPATNRSAP